MFDPHNRNPGFCCLTFVTLLLYSPVRSAAASWTPLLNTAPVSTNTMMLLNDGTVMVQNGNTLKGWLRLTPDITGSYINGFWTANPIADMNFQRLYYASQVLPDGRVFVLGGEYSGPFLDSNDAPSGEIWDPVTNSWSFIHPFPSPVGSCGPVHVTSNANVISGSTVITGIYSTDRFQIGWVVSGPGIPSGATVTSIDSSTQVHISIAASSSAISATVNFSGTPLACFGDDPSILLAGGKILAGDITTRTTLIYSLATDSWQFAGSKFYPDASDEEGWTKLPGGLVLNYDLFESINANGFYAEIYNPGSNTWNPISPSDGTANAIGPLPALSSPSIGYELGPILRLYDGRALVIGATNHTALYTPSTNTWTAGPDITAPLSNPFGTLANAAFGADDAPAAIMPNGHILFAADAGPAQFNSTGNTTAGSQVITHIPSTAGLQSGWAVSQTNGLSNVIVSSSSILTVDSVNQITISHPASLTTTATGLKFGGTFSKPTRIFDFNPTSNSVSPVFPAIPDTNLPNNSAYITRMLVLPTGQVLFSDSTSQLWVYTPDGLPNFTLRPVPNNVTYNGGGLFTLAGKQLNGQSDGSAYGDDVQSDENYPIIKLINPTGQVYYCSTFNWSSTSVATGSSPETVNFKLHPAVTAGNYSLVVSAAGISSFPLAVHITQAEVNAQ